jgi:hypothetical protein
MDHGAAEAVHLAVTWPPAHCAGVLAKTGLPTDVWCAAEPVNRPTLSIQSTK